MVLVYISFVMNDTMFRPLTMEKKSEHKFKYYLVFKISMMPCLVGKDIDIKVINFVF